MVTVNTEFVLKLYFVFCVYIVSTLCISSDQNFEVCPNLSSTASFIISYDARLLLFAIAQLNTKSIQQSLQLSDAALIGCNMKLKKYFAQRDFKWTPKATNILRRVGINQAEMVKNKYEETIIWAPDPSCKFSVS